MKIIKLEAQNIKRLKAITIYPKGAATLIGGRNAQGKSSTLDCIAMALGGTKSIPEEPVSRGAKKGHVVVETDELLIERKFSSKGSKLVVRNKAGIEQKSPQALLDSLYGSLAFDPLKFSQDKPPKQAETIRKLAGLDFSELDEERQAAFDQRTDVNRETKRLAAVLQSLPETVEGLPVVEVTSDDLIAELEDARKSEEEARRLEDEATAADEHHEDLSCQQTDMLTRIESLREELKQLETVALPELEKQLAEADKRANELRTKADDFAVIDPEPIKERLRNAEETNRKVRANAERVSVRRQLSDSEDLAEELTEKIKAIDEKKASLVESAKLPVPGLGFDETGPTLNGIALEQCSQAERLRVSVAIGLAFNPRLRVMLVREGAFLDEDSLALLAQLAEEADAQVFIERVGSGDEGAIIIEDGEVLEVHRGAAE